MSESVDLQAMLRAAREQLAGRSDSAGLDAELLLAAALGKPRSFLYAWPDHQPTSSVRERFADSIRARAAGQPVAYTLGSKEFFGLDLAVTPAVLIPRPDTELLVEQVLERLDAGSTATIADLGTGSGAVALALARHLPAARVLGTDSSAEALKVARANARELRLEVDFLRGDWCAPLGDASVDVLVANPPYVAEGDPHLAELAAEPLAALVSGPEGLDALRTIIGQSPRVLRTGGWLVLEHGFDQGGAVRTLLAEAGFSGVTSARDLGGHERVSLGHRP
ncbi:peptide chain release factor N(5)-glutamine methyltransferase [Algiphilus aromaticivorans]|uniref:peptide chain release factor N(5)-glutamine methyltransferase n=1 Tax=Algiphilus aromaticivorans TaxID=382454 RepID=UPI0005C1E44B|nr:peptide chain release factor N(5)-glutamine methyltransferase [Algiphilus aromaticivorans]